MSRPIVILIAGDPVPSARRAHGNFDVMIQRAAGSAWAGPWQVLDLRALPELPRPDEAAAVIVSGSPARLAEKTHWMQLGMGYLQDLAAAATPTLGICFGHQMLGEALGGRVGVNPQGREIGSVEVEILEDNPLFERVPPLAANTTHLDSVLELPRGARVVARTAAEPHAAVRFSDVVWGVQFHPEIDAEILRCYISDRSDDLRAEGRNPEALCNAAHDAPTGRAVLKNFIQRIVPG